MARALVVDDDQDERLLLGHLLEHGLGLSVVYADDGLAALEVMARQTPELVLTDMQMPRMNGLELVAAVRDDYPSVPVILVTAHGSEELVVEALRRGSAGYVTKKYITRDLVETVRRVLAVAHVQCEQDAVVQCLAEADFHFVLDNDSDKIHPLILYLRDEAARIRLCDETGLMRIGVALDEALCNAIHHGNLGVMSELRQGGSSDYWDAIEERRRAPPWCDRKTRVTASFSHDQAVYVIEDEGEGFNPAAVPDPTLPSNIDKVSGRGLLLIRAFMDEVRYNETGNQITMIKRRDAARKEA